MKLGINVCLNASSIINKKNELNIVEDVDPRIIGIPNHGSTNTYQMLNLD